MCMNIDSRYSIHEYYLTNFFVMFYYIGPSGLDVKFFSSTLPVALAQIHKTLDRCYGCMNMTVSIFYKVSLGKHFN